MRQVVRGRDLSLSTFLTAVMMRVFCAAILSWSLLGRTALASGSKIEIQLIPRFTEVLPGEKLDIVAHFSVPADWHIYWKEPGVFGLPTKFHFSIRGTETPATARWAIPNIKEHAADVGLSFQYDTAFSVVFSEIAMPEEHRDVVPLVLHWKWLECSAEVCIPKSGETSIQLPMIRVRESSQNPLYEQFARQVPEPEFFQFERTQALGGDGQQQLVLKASPQKLKRSGIPKGVGAYIGPGYRFESGALDQTGLALTFSVRDPQRALLNKNRQIEGFIMNSEGAGAYAFYGRYE